jgi:ankyrin repeat protein
MFFRKPTPQEIQDKLNRKLAKAARRGKVERVRQLLAAGADVHADNEAALFGAVRSGNPETVRVLVEAKADITTRVTKGYTPPGIAILWWAAYYNRHAETLRILLGAGAVADKGAALCIALSKKKPEIAHVLLDSGVDSQDDKDRALWCAADDGYPRMVKALLAAGADPLANNSQALRVAEGMIHMAARCYTNPAPWEEAAAILKEAGDKALAELRARPPAPPTPPRPPRRCDPGIGPMAVP